MEAVEKWSIRAEIWWRTKQYAWRTFWGMIREREGLRRAVRLAWACRDGGEYWLCDDCGKATKKRHLREVWMLCGDICPECRERLNDFYYQNLAEFEAKRGA